MREGFFQQTDDRATSRVGPTTPRAAWQVSGLLLVWLAAALPAVVAQRAQYTLSLSLFVAPLVLSLHALHRAGRLAGQLRALRVTLLLLVPMGVVLTLGLADDFFRYPTPEATLGLTLPTFDLLGVHRGVRVPIEELAFYALGFAALLSAYLWLDAELLPLNRPLHRRIDVSLPELINALGAGVALAAAGWTAQRFLQPAATMPGYWLYLMLVPVPVLLAFGPAVAHRINWPALAILCLGMWGHSILWEVSLGIPQGWWAYQPDAVIGVRVAAWHQLPVEAVLVWLLTPLCAVVTLEAVRSHLIEIHRRAP